MPDAHSLFSASGSDGWLVCHGKLVMEKDRRTSSEYADEGTAAHTLGDWVLQRRLKGEMLSASAYLGRKIKVKRDDSPKPRVFVVDEDMAEHVDTYVDSFMRWSNSKRAMRFCEQQVCYAPFLKVPLDLAWGTSDGIAVILDAPRIEWPADSGIWFPAGVEVQIHDLKYGAGVRVFADGPQMRHYALGVLNDFEFVADFTRVRMVIHQPRMDHVDEHVMSVGDLKDWARSVAAPAAKKVLEVMTSHSTYPPEGGFQSPEDVPASLLPHLKPSEKGCRFCDAKAICPALLAEVAEGVSGGKADRNDFRKLRPDTPAEVRDYGDNWLAVAASKLELIDVAAKAIRAEIDRRVLSQGKTVQGFKVVMGAQGDRAWTDKAQAEARLKALRLPRESIYASKLISPTQAEKLLKKTAPGTWADLQELITRAEGKPAVVPDTDKRAPYDGHRAKSSDFRPVAQARGVAGDDQSHPFR